MAAKPTCAALRRALWWRTRSQGIILPFDPRRPSCAPDRRRLLKARGLIAHMMSKKGDRYGHTAMESGNHGLKVKVTYEERFATRQAAKNRYFEYIEI